MNTADLELIHANITKTMAETMKLGAETSKINAELRYYPLVAIGIIAVGALGTIAAVLVKVL
ncbi:hypothetical protein [Luteibacter sp. OK325]|uniref:hypothetical protein n=1 Tax=Luteibacter sp. OK325 TaxID=2135670 RepID=UPI0011B1E0C1|nr:hypothetical protein [Luteibacter sp. OK325]